ncbi:TetR/AcrR family transcriptional regulator [Neobacillus sp. NPDC093127]|uniref:TetR/AcrR family transcriptional regulator n=1 Tax=Neobacillus sp. NPDC093127 TaxID=3364296 RepID=UPI0038295E52
MPPIVSESHKEKKRKEILDSALVCFAKKGLQAATMDDIVEHSGISKGAIYNYFKSKDEIYLELMDTDTQETYENLAKGLLSCKNNLEKITYLFDVYLNVDLSKDESKGRFIVHNEFKLHASRYKELADKLTDRRIEYLVKLFAGIITEGQETGEIKQGLNPEIMADLFWAMISGVTLQTIYRDYPYNQVLTEMKQMFINTVKA